MLRSFERDGRRPVMRSPRAAAVFPSERARPSPMQRAAADGAVPADCLRRSRAVSAAASYVVRFAMPAFGLYASAAFAVSARVLKPSGSFTAMSASTLRLMSTFAAFRPCMKLL